MTRRRPRRPYLLVFIIASLIGPAASAAFAQQVAPRLENEIKIYSRPTILPLPVPLPRTTVPGTPDIKSQSAESIAAGSRGVLVETLDGKVVLDQTSGDAFNPASSVKLVTALAALRSLGPHHRFTTGVWTNGTLDRTTGTITGNLIISGRDPSFNYAHAVMLALELNRLGIRSVTGDLIVAPRFTMNFHWSSQRSGDQLYDALDASRRPAAAVRAWNQQRSFLGGSVPSQGEPSVAVMGAVYVDGLPPNARMLVTQSSSELVDILKVLLCYSNNFMAERIGETLGGPEGVQRLIINDLGISPEEVRLASTSGLGVNRVTPRAMMKIFRALRMELGKHTLSVADIMPVAGIDPGTLEKRFTGFGSRGSVIAKTGSLFRTDGGASSLVGQMRTASNETLLFVIFNMHGSVPRFREYQDSLVSEIQTARGGPAPFVYNPQSFASRFSGSIFNSTETGRKDEFEPASN